MLLPIGRRQARLSPLQRLYIIPSEFLALIGQRCAAILYGDTGDPVRSIPFDTLRRKMAQLAAVAVAGVEAMDEERASWPT